MKYRIQFLTINEQEIKEYNCKSFRFEQGFVVLTVSDKTDVCINLSEINTFTVSKI